jgi:hypothetical protein
MCWFSQPQQARRYVPAVTVVCNHGHGLFVIASQDSENRTAVLGLERNAIADPKLKHGLMGMRLIHDSEALHDAMIQIYELGFSQMINVDAIHASFGAWHHLCYSRALTKVRVQEMSVHTVMLVVL